VRIIPEAGDFKLLSRRAVQEICRCSERKPFPRGLAIWLGFRQAIVRYTREGRRAGRSKCPVLGRRVRDYFLDTALVSFSEAPLKLALYAGLFITAAASLGLLALLAGKAAGLPSAAGWSPVLLVAVTVLGGFQLLASGILGLYVNAIHGEVRRRPPFVIRERIGFAEDVARPLPGGPSAAR
jgi:dolichol-phosphate mannosyltransferase